MNMKQIIIGIMLCAFLISKSSATITVTNITPSDATYTAGGINPQPALE